MGILKPLTRTLRPLRPERLPSGCFTLHRGRGLVASTLPSSFSRDVIMEIGELVITAFKDAQESNLALTDLNIHYSGLQISARELRGGALVFLQPATLQLPHTQTEPAMHYKNLDEFILHLENYIECWKQFNHYVNLARDKKFSRDDEAQFLEIKSVIAQGLEAILASTEKGGPKKEEVHQLFANAPSLRYLADMSDVIPTVESHWHKVYLGLQSLLGQLKVQQNKSDKGVSWSLFGRK
jgi:hypothetical protein